MLLLFIEGEKGLLARGVDGKVYFPLKNGSITKPGIYNCEELIDKTTYGFVNGTKVKCEFPSEEYVKKNLMEADYKIDKAIIHYDQFKIKQIGDDPIIFMHNTYGTWYVYIYRRGYDGVGLENCVMHVDDSRIHKHIYNPANFEDSEEFFRIRYDFNESLCEKINMDKIFHYLVALFCTNNIGYYSSEKIDSVTIYDEKIIKIVTTTFGTTKSTLYAYNSNHGFIYMNSIQNIDPTNSKKIDISELKNFMLSNRYGYGHGQERPIITNTINVMDKEYTFKCYNGMLALSEITEEEKKEVNESFEELARLRKYMGKNYSKQILTELQKISDVKILNIGF